jgi:hypothetical protein
MLMCQKLKQLPMLLGMLIDLDHKGPNPDNYIERNKLVGHDQEKHKLDKNIYMHISFWKSKERYESLDQRERKQARPLWERYFDTFICWIKLETSPSPIKSKHR